MTDLRCRIDLIARRVIQHGRVRRDPARSPPVVPHLHVRELYVHVRSPAHTKLANLVSVADRSPLLYTSGPAVFQHIDIPPTSVHILNGSVPDLIAECRRYEEKIKSFGGIELFFGGIGEDGHLAFNEPGEYISRCLKHLAFQVRLALTLIPVMLQDLRWRLGRVSRRSRRTRSRRT